MFIASTFEITGVQLSCAFVSCFELGASAEWLGPVDAKDYAERSTYDANFAFVLHYDGPDDEEESYASVKVVDNEAVEAGLAIMARKYPRHFLDLALEQDDAATHDVLLQCVVFGEIIYG